MSIILSLLLSEDEGQDHRYDQILDDLRKIARSCIVWKHFFLDVLNNLNFDGIAVWWFYDGSFHIVCVALW
jgi:hypothetical protein